MSHDYNDCPTLADLLPRFDSAPSMTNGVDNYRVAIYLMLSDFDVVLSRLEMLGLDENVMLSMWEARETLNSELMCEDLIHHEIFEQFLKDGMKYLPALRAAHRV